MDRKSTIYFKASCNLFLLIGCNSILSIFFILDERSSSLKCIVDGFRDEEKINLHLESSELLIRLKIAISQSLLFLIKSISSIHTTSR